MRKIRIVVAGMALLLVAGIAGAAEDVSGERSGNIVVSGRRTAEDSECSRYAATGSRTCTDATAANVAAARQRPDRPGVTPVRTSQYRRVLSFLFRNMER